MKAPAIYNLWDTVYCTCSSRVQSFWCQAPGRYVYGYHFYTSLQLTNLLHQNRRLDEFEPSTSLNNNLEGRWKSCLWIIVIKSNSYECIINVCRMEFILSLIILTALLIFLIHKSISVLARYIRIIQTAERVPGFSDTRLIQGDLWVRKWLYQLNIVH